MLFRIRYAMLYIYEYIYIDIYTGIDKMWQAIMCIRNEIYQVSYRLHYITKMLTVANIRPDNNSSDDRNDSDNKSKTFPETFSTSVHPDFSTFSSQHPKSSKIYHCPKNGKPGELIEVQTITTSNKTTHKRKGEMQKPNKYVAVPNGIKPGEPFHVPVPLTTGQVKEVLMAGTAPGFGSVELQLTRSLVMQEVQGTFVDLKSNSPSPNSTESSKCIKKIQCCAGTSCMHPFCFCFGCSSISNQISKGTGREFLFKDGHSSNVTDGKGKDPYLYLVKERSHNGFISVRRWCHPNHSLILEAYRVLPIIPPNDGSSSSNEQILRPDIKRGPEFTVIRRGHCFLSCCAAVKECKHKFVVHDRNVSPGDVKPGKIIGMGYQQTCGGSPCFDCTPEAMLCCTPTIAVMRRDTVMTANGWGSADRVLGMLEGPCCCYDGFCCRKRAKHWFFSQTPGKAYDVGALMFSNLSRHHVPNTMLKQHVVGKPILMEFTKRNLSNVDKKLIASTMLLMKYMFLREWWQGVMCCNFHCCGANFQC
jgi:hypothetical protein